MIGAEVHHAGAGTVAFVPAGTPHGFANLAPAPARFVEIDVGGTLERYRDDAS